MYGEVRCAVAQAVLRGAVLWYELWCGEMCVATLCYGKRLWCGEMCCAMAQAMVW